MNLGRDKPFHDRYSRHRRSCRYRPGNGTITGGEGDFHFGGLLNKAEGDQGVMAYLNYLVFNKDGTGKSHEELSKEIVITEPGLVYIYLSNDSPTPMEVFFDDFKVEHIKNPILQADDYYPFGLSFNSYKRENSISNRWKFQGQEHIEDLGLDWVSFKWRNHDPAIGRFFNVDPLAEDYVHWTPYAFSGNQVISHIELEGLEPIGFQIAMYYALADKKTKRNIDSGLMIVGGAAAIIASAGSATPFVAVAGVIGGSSSVAFGGAKLVSNNIEGGESDYEAIPSRKSS